MESKSSQLEQTGSAEKEGDFDRKADEELRNSLSAIDSQYVPQRDVPRRIHLVGTGNIGKIVAHALRGIDDPPPISLILHRYKLLQAWEKSKKVITLQDEEYTIERGGFDVEFSIPYRRVHGIKVESGEDAQIYHSAKESGIKPHEMVEIMKEQRATETSEQNSETSETGQPSSGKEALQADDGKDRPRLAGEYAVSNEPIYNLIVATKTIRTVVALLALKHRISKDTTICFLQNGMGLIDDVNREVFPDEATRPTYVQGIVSHGANIPAEKTEIDPFFAIHAAKGTIALGVVPKRPLAQKSDRLPESGSDEADDGKLGDKQVEDLAPTTRYLIRALARAPTLCAVPFTPLELLQLQLEKLVINSIINPLTSLLDNRNGSILYNFALSRTMRLMIAETSLIIQSLPELRGLPNVPHRFSTERLEDIVKNGADKTRNNVSSMLQDIRAGRQTEIEYINGFIVRRGEQLGIKAVVNYAIMQTVLAKSQMIQHEITDNMPFDGEPGGVNRE